MPKHPRIQKLAEYLDGKLLKLGITLGATKTVEATVNTLITTPGFKILAWITFLTLVITSYVFQDQISEKTEEIKEKAEETVDNGKQQS